MFGKQVPIRIHPVTMRAVKHINGYISLNGHTQRSSLNPSLGANLFPWQDWEVPRRHIILSPFSKHPSPSVFTASNLACYQSLLLHLFPCLDCIFRLCWSFSFTALPTIPHLVCRHLHSPHKEPKPSSKC